jgi:PKD repeat protein
LNSATTDTLMNLGGGVYSVDVHTVGSCDNGNQSFTLVSPPAPVASFVTSADTVYLSSGNAVVSFTNTSSNVNSYYWNFGNGNTSSSMNPQNTYTLPGHETVVLSAFNSNCSDTVKSDKVIVVLNPLGINTINKSNVVTIGQDITGTFVKFDYSNQTKTVISVYDILGQRAINDINADVVNDVIYLDLNNVHNQILLISVTTEDKRVVKKIFKQ